MEEGFKGHLSPRISHAIVQGLSGKPKLSDSCYLKGRGTGN